MIHKDKDQFLTVLNRTVKAKPFLPLLLEKDYYLTLILSKLSQLSDSLVFKGGTCLNKIYFSYYRLSEDLDFSMRLPEYTVTRGIRRKCIQPLKDKIVQFAEQLEMRIDETDLPGRNESKQYVWYFIYPSVLRPTDEKIKFEVGLRYNPLLKAERHAVHHHFLHPFTGEFLFTGGEVDCLSLNEIIAEKLRAAATRKTIAPRDFYDLDFILRKDKKLINPKVLELFRKKLAEDDADTSLDKYRRNLGRGDEEIKDMNSRITEELFDVLTVDERTNFNLAAALQRINCIFKNLQGLRSPYR